MYTKFKKVKCATTYMMLEYIIAVYVVLSTIINLLNILDIMSFYSWFMKPTFFGHSLLVVLILECFVNVNKDNAVLSKIRPYIIGTLIANIISTCSLSLWLMLLLAIGCFLLIGYKTHFAAKGTALTALFTCTVLEIYSIAIFLQGSEPEGMGGFLESKWLDALFVLSAIVYCMIYREPESIETAPTVAKEKKIKFRKVRKYLQKNSLLIVRSIGGVLCVISAGLFLFVLTTTVAGANKLERSGEMVYLLQNCEDTSLVLTLTEDKDSETYKVSFEKYEGTANQKVQLIDTDDGMYQIVFLEPMYALLAEASKNGKNIYLSARSSDGSSEQKWRKVPFDTEQGFYSFYCVYDVPLCYEIMAQAKDVPKVSVKKNSGGYELFIIEQVAKNEFIGSMVEQYRDKFAPTLLMETLISYMSGWSCIVFILLAAICAVILYARRITGDTLAMLNVVLFVYLLAYGAVSAIALFLLGFAIQCMTMKDSSSKDIAV